VHSRDIPWNEYAQIRDKYFRFFPKRLNDSAMLELWSDININIISGIGRLATMDPILMDVPLGSLDSVPKSASAKRALKSIRHKWDRSLRSLVAGLHIENPSFSASKLLLATNTSPHADIMLTISGFELIDTKNATLEQIEAFREDPLARQKLRQLRLFALNDYSGKSPSYIQDDLLSKLDAYQREAKHWSFDTKRAAISMLFNSKFIAGGVGLSLIGALLQQPLISAASLSVGTLAEFGNIALEVSRMKSGR
jgi:hypothetical protein